MRKPSLKGMILFLVIGGLICNVFVSSSRDSFFEGNGESRYGKRKDILCTWPGSGVWCRFGSRDRWEPYLEEEVGFIASGDIDGDSLDDFIYEADYGVYVKYAEA